jgi:hypothetical protein
MYHQSQSAYRPLVRYSGHSVDGSSNKPYPTDAARCNCVELVMIRRRHLIAGTVRERYSDAIRKRYLVGGLVSPDFLPKCAVHIFSHDQAEIFEVCNGRFCCRFIRRPKEIVIDFAEIDRMSDARVGSIREQCLDDKCARFIAEERDHRTRIKDNNHDRRSSRAISSCFDLANASLLVGTCAYLPRTARTRAILSRFAISWVTSATSRK